MSKQETFTLRIETELLDDAHELARERRTTLSALIREALLELTSGRQTTRPRPKTSRQS